VDDEGGFIEDLLGSIGEGDGTGAEDGCGHL
jgi:hypothetical protein